MFLWTLAGSLKTKEGGLDMIPIFGDLIKSTLQNTLGKIVDAGVKKFLPASMTEAEKAAITLQVREYTLREMEANTDIIEVVNATMQVEAKSEKWWVSGWRPYWGFISGTAFLFVCALVCYLIYLAVVAGKPEVMAIIPQVIGAFAALFAIPGAILGVTAWHRGKKQRIEAGER